MNRPSTKKDKRVANENTGRFPASLAVREMHIKTTRYHFTPTRIPMIKESEDDVEKLEPSYTAGRNVKWYNCF